MFTRLSSVVCAAVLAGCSSSTNPAPQAAPGSVQAQACGRRAIEITWDQPAANLTAVAIERSRDGGPFESVAGTAADATSYVDYGLDAGTSYSYRLANINGAGASTYSSIVSATASSPDLILVSVVNPSGEFQLAVTSADQPQSTRLITPPSGLQFRLVDPRLHDDDRLILYVAGPESQPAESQVFAVPVCGDAPPRELTPPNANSTFEVYDDRYMVALTRSSLTTELMSVDLRGTDTVLLTSAPGGTQTFRWDPNARLGNGDLFFGDGDIWAVPVDGSAPPRPFGLGTPWPEQFATDANGNVLTLPDAVAVLNPSGIPSSSDRLVLARDGGETFLDQSGQNAQLTSLSIVANHLVWVRRASGIGQADISLRSGDTTQPRRVLTPNSIIQWDGLRNGLDLVFTMGSTLRPAPVMGLYSVPITGATAPTLLTTGAPTELSVIANVGDTVVYTRSSSPGAAFTCRIGGPMSEASIATSGVIDGSSAVFAAEGGQERAAQAVILRNVTTVGANTYTDFWSVTEDSAGATTVHELSNQGTSQTTPDGTIAPRLIETLSKEGRVFYQRGPTLYSAQIGVAGSERPLSAPGVALNQIRFDTTNTDGTAYFVAQGQVWSTPIDGRSPPVQLSSLPPLPTAPVVWSIGPSGTVAFTSESAGTTTAWIAQAGVAESATAISGAGSPAVQAAF